MFRHRFIHLVVVALLLQGCALLQKASVGPHSQADDYYRASPEASALYQFSRGRLLADDGRYGEAVEAMRQAVALDPRSAYLRISLAELLLQAGEDQEALEAAKDALQQDPGLREAHLLLGGLYFRDRDYARAVEHFKRVVELDPDNENAYLHLAVTYSRLGEKDLALSGIHDLLARHPDSLAGRLTEARLFRDLELPSRAEAAYRKLIDSEPGLTSAYLELGRILENARRLAEAAEIYRAGIGYNDRNETLRRRLILTLIQQEDLPAALVELKILGELVPFDLDIRRKIGLIQLDQQQWREAEESFRRITENEPLSAPDLFYLGSSLERQERWEEAAAAFAGIGREADLYPDALYHRSFLAQQSGKTVEAIELLNERIALAADRSDLFEDLATLQEHAGDVEAARQTLDLGLVHFPANADLNYRRGLLLERQGDRAGAMKAMTLVLELSPENPEALNFIAYCLAEAGENLAQALEMVQRALVQTRAPHILDTLGWIYFRMGNLEQARPPLEEAIHQLSTDPVVWEHLGDLYLQLDENHLARNAFRKALEFDPDNHSLLEKLDRAEGLP
jgi:tetratricopeptide (TPR) repeat protein